MTFSSYNLEGLEREFHDAKNRVLCDENLSFEERQEQLEQIRDECHRSRAILEGTTPTGLRDKMDEAGGSEGASSLARILASRRRRRSWK